MCCTEVIGNVLKFPPLTFFRFEIPRQRLIVVRSTVDYGVRVIAVRQMLVETVATERKLNDLHARIARLCQQILDLLTEDTQILRDDLRLACRLIKCVGQLFARTFLPLAVFRSHSAIRDCIILHHADEMVDPHRIVELRGRFHPASPPGEIGLFHFLPVVKRVAPELSIL